MNKIYKVVWNASIGTWIVVSELAKSKTRTGSVSSSSEITGSQNEIVSKEKKFRPKALVLSIISCLAVSHVWADYTNLYGSIIDTSPTISNGIAIGANTGTPATANDSNGLAVGSRANASAADSTALGNYVNATGVNSTVVGGQASAAGAQSIALQNNSDADLVAEGLATGSSFTAVDSASSYSVAIGAMSQVVGSTAAMAIGKNAQVNSGANNATAIGNTATVDTNAVDGVAIGTNSLTSAANSVALGPRSTANVTNSVALGAGSTTTVQSGNSYITNVAASTTNGVVSVGSATNTRRIQNVADGAADSDAVTVAQLKDVNNRAVGNTTALGGGAAYNPATDVYTPPSYTITKTDGTTYTPVNTVSGALTNLNNEVVKPITFAGNTGSSANNLGTTLNITGGGSTAGTYSGNNLKTAVTGNTVNIQMADAPVFSGTVTAGNLTTGGSLNVTGASNLNGGANLNNQKITNLAAGTISSTSTDAVNGSQLNTTNQNVTTAQNTANTAVTNAAAAQNTANTAVTNAAAAQATADKGLNFSVNGGTADNVKLGETVNFANGTNTTAVYDPATNTYKYSVNDNIVLTNAGSLTVGNSKVDNNGLTITGGPSVTTAGINAGNQKITNVAAGTISSTSTDAVNGSQLNTTNQNVTTAQNTANTAVTNAAAAQNTANTAVTNAAAAQATADKGLNFSVNGGTADNVKLGETVNFANGTNTTAVYDPATNTYKYNVNDNIALTNAGSLTVGNSKVDNSGLTITGGPSVTTAGINAGNQKITNVAAGTISSTSTDAVNGSQLNTTNQNVTTAQNTANTAVTNAAAAQATADKGLNFSVNGGTADNVKLGEMVNFADGTNTTAVYDPATNTYKYNVNDNIALTNAGSLTVGNTKVDNSGLTITGGPSVTTAGINAGNQKITNVTAGTISATSTDAVNGSQLNTTNQNVTTAQNTANTAVTNAAAAQNTANTAVTNAAAAQATADKGLNFSVNGGTADNVKLGETVNFADGTNTTAVYDPATNTYKYNVNDNIALTNAGSLTVGNTKVDNSGLTITGGPSVTTAGINAGNQKITNVTAGTISATSTDAVNGSQLNTTNQNVTTAQNTANTAVTNAAAAQNTANTAVTNAAAAQATADKGLNFSVNGGTADNVKLGETVNFADGTNTTAVYDSATNTYKYNVNDNIALTNAGSLTVGNTKVDNSGLTITGGPSVTTAGINAGNQKITNVAAGTNATDAVNVSQLDALSTSSNNKTDVLGNSTANNLGGGASYDSTTGAVSSPTYTVNGNNVNNVGDAITALDKGWTLQSNGTNAAAVKAGDTVDIGTVAGETNLKVTKTGNTIQYGLNRDLNIDSVTAGDSKLDTNGLTITGGPSVTKTGIDAAGNTISNVAAGTNATDAVNKGQLDALSTSSNNKTDALGNSTANNLGGGASYDSTTGAVSSPTYVTTKTDGTTVNANNVGDALTNLNNEVVKPITFAGNSGSVDRKLGETLNITGGLTASGSNSNVKTVISGNTVDIQLADAPVFAGKLTANGLDANGEKVTNVGAGTAATDAVNKGQLDALSTSSNNKTDALGNSTANNLGGGASYDSTTGAVSSPTYTVNGNNVNNVGDAITALDKGWTLQSNGTNAAAVKAGDTVDIGTVAGETNLKVTKTGNTIQYGLNRDLNIDSVTAGDSKLDTNGLTITGGPSVTKTGIDAAGNTISNVAAGTNATDAVNKGQLDALSTSSNNKTDALGNSTANNLGGGASYDSTTGAVSSPTYVTTKTDGTTVNANNVGDALTNLNNEVVKPITFAGNSGSVDRKLGETLNITGGLTASGSNSNVKTVISGNTVDIQLADAPVFAGKLTANGLDANGEKVTNVGAGTAATDAVNKGQLDALSTSSNNKTDALGNSTANNLGGGASYDSTTGAVSSPTYTVNGNNVNNVGDAITALDKGWTLQSNGTNAAAVKAGDTVDIGTVAGETNLKVTKTGNTIQYGLNRDLNIDSVTAGDSKLDTNGLTIAGGPSVTKTGIDVAGNTIGNVAAGTNATDAVNKGQLDALSTSSNNKTDALGNSTANNLGGGASYDSTTGAVSSPTYTVNGNNVNNVGDAITALDKGWTLQSNGTNAAAVKAGDTVDIGTVAGETNLKVTKTGNTIQYGLNRDLNIDSVTAGDSKLDTNGLTITGGPSVTKTGIDAAGNTISNVAAGTNATDAVNKGQLDALSTSSNNKTDALGNSTANNLGGGASYDSTTGAVSSPTYVTTKTDGTTVNANNVGDALTNLNNEVVKPITFAGNSGSVDRKLGETLNITGGLTASGSNSNVKTVISGNTVDIQLADAPVFAGKLTANGLDANGEKVTNVGAGTAATDAVNKGQLDALSTSSNNKTDALGNSTANNLGGGASYDSTTGAVSSPTYTVNGNNVNNVGDAITALDKGWTLQSNGTNAAAVKAGDTVDIGTVAGETNLKVTKTGNTIQYGLNRDLNIDSVTAGDSKLDTNGLTIAGGPSVTKTGIDAAGNTISNVAAGTNATDAVNKGQLDHVDNRVTQVTNTTASIFGGGAKANTDGSISNPTYNVAGTSANNVGDALTALDKAVTDAGTAANAGWTVSANGDAATAKKIKPNGKVNFTGDDNLTVAQSSETDNEGNIKVALNKNLKVDSVTTGNTVIDTTGVKVGDNVQLGSTGLIIAGGPSITTSGISAGNKTISNVAAGVSSTDAVNKGQLDSAISSINNNVGALANSAVQYDKNSDGSVNKDSITLAGGANGTTIKNVANGTVAEGSKDAVNGGQLWTVQQQVNKNTGDISNLQTDISNINNGKSGLVQQADKDAAITVGKDTGGTQVNVAGTAGERTVTGVKAGAVTESSKDAVNGSQLNTTNQALVNYLGGGAGYDNITQSFSNPTYNVGDQSYHNVGDAIGALNQADQTLNTKIDNVSNKLEQAFYATNQRIDDVEKRANAGIAAAMALENAPFVAGKYTYAVGAAYHGGENAVGVTLRKTADNGRWSLTGGVAAASQGDPSVRIGISGVID
ncbi:ESPR-type extended signal peptide-containing protein [Acinetobacter baumannii]|uniref:ESPR-type extended signal peptide-containing protein n=3 Tax=Acinetobacter baumannii TaxID=470 RepID=UPI0021F6F654|nr:ESPR-type extended signal peptide-containing protein [Acinetobacter baumannii]UYQ16855.1 ESPR-type extended signal peptide-containing protein [Acinetobacter baumannii]